MAKQVFVGNGEKDPSLVGGDEREVQPPAPCPGHPQSFSRYNASSLGQVLHLHCDISLARGAQSHSLRSRDDTQLAWTQAGTGEVRLVVSTGQSEDKGSSFPQHC